MSKELVNLMKRDFKKVKREAKKLIDNGSVELIDIDKRIISIRSKLLKKAKWLQPKLL